MGGGLTALRDMSTGSRNRKRNKVAFVWYGITGRYGIWKDGLWAAMRLLEKEYDVTYHEPTDEIPEDAVVLLWEAPCTAQSRENAWWYERMCSLPNKKILLFAGGPLKREWMDRFDHICVESRINAKECEEQGLPYSTAFGINSDIFRPMGLEKTYDGIHHGTCASWKRQWLVGETLRDKALIVGRGQDSDPSPFQRCRDAGATVLDEKEPEDVAILLNSSLACVQTSDYWGGGQRCTLEAMACGIPPIVMSDSPKNREYVEESGFGLVCDPDGESIRRAVEEIRANPPDPRKGREYIESKWTPRHYAKSLKAAIEKTYAGNS